ncbi:hypothetical protein Gohar_004798 [Gossypium harknessii]|uniref:Uncharacterized protein n=1 Tax=Gossypium harknessii TaxID=34285 RepID=A0A7J9H6C6_9ROSI|nr:hypothetical protein [Gossypium harknessii]
MVLPLPACYKPILQAHLNRCLVQGNTLLSVYSILSLSRDIWGFLFPSLFTVYPFLAI